MLSLFLYLDIGQLLVECILNKAESKFMLYHVIPLYKQLVYSSGTIIYCVAKHLEIAVICTPYKALK